MIPIPSRIKNILIIRLGAIGDVIQTLPTITQLKKNFPQARIHWAIEEKSYPIIKDHPGVEFHIFPKEKLRMKNPIGAFFHLWMFARSLRDVPIDLAIDLQGLFKSGLVAYLSGPRMKLGFHRFNTREGNCLFLDSTLPPIPERTMHRIDFYQQMIPAIGGQLFPLDDPFEFHLTETEEKGFKVLTHRLRIKSPYILLNLGSSKQTKRWSAQGFIQLIQSIRQNYARHHILLTGSGEADSRFEREILKSLEPQAVQSAVNKTSLRELALLVKNSAFLVSGDSLALHLGSAFRVPSIGLFGGSALAIETKPYWPEYPGLDHPIPCYPCRKKTCSHHSCMVNLTSSTVFENLLRLYPPPVQKKRS